MTVFAEVICKDAYPAYRLRLEALLRIPAGASELEIHQLIEAGFSSDCVNSLRAVGALSPAGLNIIIPLRTLNTRLLRGQRLTPSESDRLFRVAHITAMAETLFGNETKARRWLGKRKNSFLGSSPIAMLSTSQGTRAVEELMLQIAEGYAL